MQAIFYLIKSNGCKIVCANLPQSRIRTRKAAMHKPHIFQPSDNIFVHLHNQFFRYRT